jgi:hypothetical protein
MGMSESLKDDADNVAEREPSSGQPSEGPSGLGNAEASAGGADAVPDTPDNVPADGAE